MKPVVIFLVSFLVAMAGSAGAKYATAKPSALHAPEGPSADSAHADSTAAHDTSAPSMAHETPVNPSSPIDSTKAPPSASPQPATAPTPNAPATTAPTGHAAADSAIQASERRLAKVFTSMDAKQAAKVLEHMADDDIRVILGYIGPRQAAPILAALPPQRVAALSKQSMSKR